MHTEKSFWWNEIWISAPVAGWDVIRRKLAKLYCSCSIYASHDVKNCQSMKLKRLLNVIQIQRFGRLFRYRYVILWLIHSAQISLKFGKSNLILASNLTLTVTSPPLKGPLVEDLECGSTWKDFPNWMFCPHMNRNTRTHTHSRDWRVLCSAVAVCFSEREFKKDFGAKQSLSLIR